MKKRKAKIDASVFLLAAIIIFLSAGIVVAALTLRSDVVADVLANNRVINILYVIEKDGRPINSYVLMYYPATRRAAIFDVPSETGLLLSRINRVDRIDSVYNPDRLRPFESEIERLLGININFTFVITVENLGNLVDLLGGVEVFIPAPVDIRNEYEVILFPSGMVLLDGNRARTHAVFEIPGEDHEMAAFRRQRFFLAFLRRQVEMTESLRNPALARKYHSFLRTDMSNHTRMRLFDELARINMDRVVIHAVEGSRRDVSGQTLLLPHWEGGLVRDIVRQTVGALTRQVEGAIAERTLTVEILNGTAVAGLAARTAELLRSFGYDVISIGNAYRNNIERTEIVDRFVDEEMGRAFADIIRGTNIRREPLAMSIPEIEFGIQDFEHRADFTLILGRDFNGRFVVNN